MTQTGEAMVVVYRATNLVNGKTYIGYTARGLAARERAHRAAANTGRGQMLQSAMRKYGHDSIVFEMMADFQGDEELAKAYECEAIAAYKPEYNLSYGGEGGTLHESSRQKISAANRGRKMPPSHKEKRIAFLTGRKHTDETLEKMRAAQRGHAPTRTGPLDDATKRKISAANKGRTPWTAGKTHSEETKAKIRAQRWSHSEDSIARIKVSRRLAWEQRTDAMVDAVRAAQKKAIAARQIAVQCLDDGKIFSGCSEADRFYGFRTGLVSRILKGTIVNKTGRRFTRYEGVDGAA